MKISSDDAWLAGYALGDGYFDVQYKLCICIHNKDAVEILPRIKKGYQSFGEFKTHKFKHSDNYHTYQFVKKETFENFLRFCELKKVGSKVDTWRIPKKVANSSLKIQCSFLQGLFDAEGYVYNHKYNRQVSLGLTYRNKQAIKDICNILKRLKISYDIDYDKKTSIRILIKGENDMLKFSKHINFSLIRKRDKLNNAIHTFKRININSKFDYCELFLSICGEGIEVFKPAVFIRASHCNMRCEYPCDTQYCYDNVITKTVTFIKQTIDKMNCKTIFFTGGEVMLQKDSLFHLIRILKRDGYEIILQSNGTVYDENIFDYCDMISLDFKGPSAGKNNNSDEKVIERVIKNYSSSIPVQIKFLVGDDKDYNFMKRKIKQYYNDNVEYIISPIDGREMKFLLTKMNIDKFFKNLQNIRIGCQIHKYIWDKDKRGV